MELIKFAKDQCEIFPEDSYMGEYLRKTLKMLQVEPCEDAVSREDAIKAVDRHTFNTDDGLCLNEDISIILEELPSVKPVQRWIPVSERLPSVKNYQRKYLVTLKDKTVCDAMFTECDGEHWWNYNCDDVIAWMPLPEPYKESEGDMQEIVDKKVEEMTVRKKGHWIMTNDYFTGAYGTIDYVKCSCCGEDSLEEGNFCPNCGAEMENEK